MPLTTRYVLNGVHFTAEDGGLLIATDGKRLVGAPARVSGRSFTFTPGLWMNLQLDYEFMRADREKGETIRKEVQPCAA